MKITTIGRGTVTELGREGGDVSGGQGRRGRHQRPARPPRRPSCFYRLAVPGEP